MATSSWYNENQQRHYPLVKNSYLPTDVIVDAALTIDMDVEEINDAAGIGLPQRAIKLTSISRSNSSLVFTVENEYVAVDFVFPFSTPDFPHIAAPQISTAAQTMSSFGQIVWSEPPRLKRPRNERSSQCLDEDAIAGLLVLGNTEWLLERLPAEGTTLAVDIEFEVGVVEPIVFQGVRSISVANTHRSLSPAYGQLGLTPYQPATDFQISSGRDNSTRESASFTNQCIKGDIELVPGYGCQIWQSTPTKTLTISGDLNSPEGLACEDVPRDSTERALIQNLPHSLASPQSCRHVFRTVNGAVGPDLRIIGKNGVTVQTEFPGPIVTITIGDRNSNRNCNG